MLPQGLSVSIIETIKRIRQSQKMVNLYCWRTNSGAEVDLLTEHAGALIGAYEIKWSRTIDTAHLSGLRSFQKDY
jgi:hypothetical protein